MTAKKSIFISRNQQHKNKKELLEAELLKAFETDAEDTKLKTVKYTGSSGEAAVTMADSVKLTMPSLLREIFRKGYSDLVKEEITYKLSEPAKRMLAAVYNRELFRDMTFAGAIDKLPCDDKAKKSLQKKLKGAKFETDVKNLVNIGGLSEEDAQDYAYMLREIRDWELFSKLMALNGVTNEAAIDSVMTDIDGAVVAEKTPKVTVTAHKNAGTVFEKDDSGNTSEDHGCGV